MSFAEIDYAPSISLERQECPQLTRKIALDGLLGELYLSNEAGRRNFRPVAPSWRRG